MRRAATIVLGLAYLLQASWLLQGGADLLFPRTQVVQAGAASCCNSGCGCPEDARERKSCCCFPNKAAPESDTPVPVSSFEEERCRGGGGSGAGAELVSLPALAGPTMALPIPSISILCEAPTPAPVQPVPSEPPDKIPL